jgi:ABC-2 type transport system permease protein
MRAVVVAAVYTFRQLLKLKFYILLGVIQPLSYIVLTGLLSQKEQSAGPGSIAGCTVIGMWSLILYGAGRALLRERSAGTVQFLLVTPHGLLRPVLGVCLGAAMLGILPVATSLAGGFAMGFRLDPTAVAVFVGLTPILMIGLVSQGFLLCAFFVLSRQANAFSNSLEFPVWFACGLLVPLASRPAWAEGIGAVLTPTYVGQIYRDALDGGAFHSWNAAAIMLALAAVQFVLAVPLFKVIEKRVRQRGDMAFS